MNTTKFLGVWLDSELTWQKLATVLIRKLKQNLKLLQLSKNLLDRHTKKILYYAQFYSHLKYGILVWGNSVSKVLQEKLQKLQNKAFTLIFHKDPTISNYHSNKILRIKDLIKLENCKLVYNCLNGTIPEKIREAVLTDSHQQSLIKSHNYNTRYKHNPNHPRAKLNHYQNSFLCACVRDYDALPAVTHQIKTLPLFLSRCKSYLLS